MSLQETTNDKLPTHEGAGGRQRSMPAPLHYAFKYLINPVMKLALRSPAHGLVSHQLLLLTFRGRKSGRQFTTPAGYTREDDTLYLMTASPWWKNFQDGAPVTVLLQGEKRQGQATADDDPAAVARIYQRELEAHGADYLRRRYRVNLGGDNPGFEELVAAARGTVLVTITLNGAAS